MARLMCIDVGSHAVKVAVWRQNRGAWEPDEVFREPVPQDGSVPTLEVRLSALRDLVRTKGLNIRGGDSVVAALPGELATFHRMSVPFTARDQIERTLPFAVEAEVPFDLADMVFGWRIVSTGEKTSLLVALARVESMTTWLSGLAAMGVDPSWLASDSEVVGVLAPNEAHDSGATVVVDVGHAHTLVSVSVGGVVVWCRALDVGGLTFTRAIQGALRCSFEEAEGLKHGEEEPTEGGRAQSGRANLPPAAREAFDASVGLLLAEVRATLVQAEDVIGVGVDRVLLTGGSSRIPELWNWMRADLGVPVEALGTGGATVTPGSAVVVALGKLAVSRDLERVIDLRVGAQAFHGGSSGLRNLLTYGGFGLGTFVLAALVLFGVQLWSLSSEREDVRTRIFEVVGSTFPEVDVASLEDGGAALELMAGLTEDASQRAELLGTANGLAPTVDALDALFAALPALEETPIEISDLTITRENIEFQGEAAGYAESSTVEETLKQTQRFARVTKGAETRLPTGRVRFPITIPLGEDPLATADEPLQEGE